MPSAGSLTLSGDVTGTDAATVVTAISGASPINITPSVLQWTAATATPTLTQAALASTSAGSGAAGQPMAFTAQAGQAATGIFNNGGNGADLVLSGGAGGTSSSATAGAQGYVQIANASGTLGRFGLLSGQSGTTYGAIYPGNVTPGASNYVMYWQNTGSTGPTSLQFASSVAIGLNTGGSARAQIASGGLSLAVPIGGLGAVPLSFSGQTSPNTVACGTGGTQTISSAQAIIPFFLVTTGTLTSNAIVDFGTNAVTGFFVIDLSGVGTLGAYTLGFKNGTTTKTISSTQLTNLLATGASAAIIATFGTNNITILT